MDNSLMQTIFLGTSGTTSQLIKLDIDPISVTSVANFNGSIYSTDHNRRNISVGTRSGELKIAPGTVGICGLGGAFQALRQEGPAVLSVCLGNNGSVAASDTRAAYLWKNATGDGAPIELTFHDGPICSLNIDDHVLIGLSVRGMVHGWNVEDGRLLLCEPGPPPSRKAALVHLAYWQSADAWIYPALSGDIILWDIRSKRFRALPCHQGTCYFMDFLNEGIVTAGYQDKQLKVTAPDGTCLASYSVSSAFVAGAVLPGLSKRFLLIDDSGDAGVYKANGNSLDFQETIPPAEAPYRSVTGLSPDELANMNEILRRDEIHSILQALRYARNMSAEETEALHSALANLGAKALSLEVKSEESRERQKDDPQYRLEELQLRHEQASLLHDVPGSVPSLLKYAETLAALGHVWKAASIYRRILAICPENDLSAWARHFLDPRGEPSPEEMVIELDDAVSFPMVVAAADILEVPLAGKYAIATYSKISLRNVPVNPQDIIIKLADFCAENSTRRPPGSAATLQTIVWFRHAQLTKERAIVLRNSCEEEPATALTVFSLGTGDVALVFDVAAETPNSLDFHTWNDVLCQKYDAIKQDQCYDNTYSALRQAVWQAENEASPLGRH